jgi:hypothetical protein
VADSQRCELLWLVKSVSALIIKAVALNSASYAKRRIKIAFAASIRRTWTSSASERATDCTFRLSH